MWEFERVGAQNRKKPLGKMWRLEDFAQQDEALSRIGVSRHGQERFLKSRLALEAFRALDEPEVEAILESPNIGCQFRVETFGIVDEIARMHFEEAREHHPRRVRQMGTASSLDLRQISLTDRLAKLGSDCANDLSLGHLTTQAAQGSLDQPQVFELFPEIHSELLYSICKLL
jgi:hypothetical protein